MDFRDLQESLRLAGVAPDSVALLDGRDVRGGQVPGPVDDVWAIMSDGYQSAVAGVERGSVGVYEEFRTQDEACRCALRLLTVAPAHRVVSQEEVRSGWAAGSGLTERVLQRQRVTPGQQLAQLAPGDVVDRLGPDSGRWAHADGTPFPARSLPADFASRPYHRYQVTGDLSGEVLEGVSVPWFDQPGGGAQFVFRRPVRWYLDHGRLIELVTR